MRITRNVILTLGAIAIAATFAANAGATSYYWYGSDSTIGGSGTWDTTTYSWGTTTGGTNSILWANSTADTAYFQGTAGTVTVGSGLTLGAVQFDSGGWTFTGSPVTLGGNVTISSSAANGSTCTWNTDINLSATRTFALYGGRSLVLNGLLSGAGGINGNYGSAGSGVLYITRTDNTFGGAVNLGSIILNVTKLADGGAASSLGSASSAIAFGSAATSYACGMYYIGTTDSSTNRALSFTSWTGGGYIYNNSTSSNLTFSSTADWYLGWRQYSQTLTLGGTSSGVNTIAAILSNSDYAGSESCKTSLNIVGVSKWILTGANTFTGAVTIANGAKLQIGAGTNTGSIVAPVTNNGTLYFNRSNDYSFSNVISGSGSVAQIGTGMLTLGTTNTYTGTTTVAAGTLNVTGSLAYNGADKIKVQVLGDVFNASTPTIVRAASSGLALAGVGSTAIGGDYVGVASFLGGTTSEALAMSMAWRNPTTIEKNVGGGSGVISEVLKLESTALTPQIVGLQLAYDQAAFDALGGGTSEAGVYVAWLNGDRWEKISTGTKYDSYTDGLAVGSWGIDTSNNKIWVVTDKTGSFAVIPEPGTLALLAVGVGGLMAYAWRKRK